MKYFSSFYILALGLGIASCNDNRKWKDYDKGYEAAWEGEKAPTSLWASKEEKEGYANGLDDVWAYDVGYDDGYNGRRPQYFKDRLYMDAYTDGKKDKEKRW